MEGKELKRQLKIKEWTELIAARAESGLSVEEWCERSGISRDRYYYWQRVIRKHSCNEIVAPADSMPAETFSPAFTKVELGNSAGKGISINVRGASITISPDSNTEHVRLVLEAMLRA